MVKTINNLRNRLNNWLTRLSCKIYGHSNLKLIEAYKHIQRIKIPLTEVETNKFFAKPLFFEHTIEGKFKCSHCGCVFIGTVKGNDKGATHPY